MKRIVIRILPFVIFILSVGNLYAVSADVGKGVKKPVIGIAANMLRSSITTIKNYVNEYYISAVTDAGGVPVILPVTDNVDVISGMVALIDCLILTGGADVDPLIYGEEPNPDLEMTMPRRDIFETRLLNFVMEKKLPVFGICRGEQFINVYHGGTLYQDIHQMTNSNVQHRQQTDREIGTHTVNLEGSTWLHGILRNKAIVNSLHHQAVKDLAAGFVVSARSTDGSIEAIEKIENSFCVDVQWHPERMQKSNPLMLKLFERFIEECGK